MRRRRRCSQTTMLLAVIVLCLTPAPTYASFQLDLVNVTLFQREPEASFFKPKQNGVLLCEFNATLRAQVAWYRNGTRMDWKLSEVRDKFEERRKANGSSALVFKQFMPTTHGGFYQCLLNIPSIGSLLSRPALVQLATVEMSSRGHRKENITIQIGNMALIPCDSPFDVSVPRTEVAFELNGTALQLRSDRHLITSDGKLLVMQVKQTDAGNYKCVLTNREASVSQPSNVEYSLIVPSLRRVTPVLLHKSPSLVRANVGDNVTITCIYVGNPVPEVEWELPNAAGVPTDSRLLSPNERITVETKGYLHIANVGFDDAGVYRCKYTHERGSKADAFTLQVDGPPGVNLSAANVLPTAKGITLRCDVTRSTNSFWLLNGERLNSGDFSIRVSTTTKRNGDEMRLTIQQVSQEHQGLYQCFAENQFGTSVRSARLELNAPDPSSRLASETATSGVSRRRANLIKVLRDNMTCNSGEAVAFSCESLQDVVEFRWFLNGSPLQLDSERMDLTYHNNNASSSLIISALSRNLSGMYTCIIQTPTAFDEASVYLTVLGDSPVETAPDGPTSTSVSPKPRKQAKTSPQPSLTLPTQLNARLSGRAVQLTWTIPSSEVVMNATEVLELQYCRDCRLKNAQPSMRAAWRTLNETVDLLARRYTLRGLSPATYVFRMQVRFVDGTTRISDTSPPITVTAESVNSAVSVEEDDNPFSDFRVECVSERNCSVVWARWSYSPSSRLLREQWDGVAILVSDTESGVTIRKLVVAGFKTAAYQVGVESNRQLEFSVSLIRSGERSPGRSAVINTYADEEGMLNVLEDLEAMLPHTTAQPFVQIPVEAVEFADEADLSENSNGSLAGEEGPTTVTRSVVLDRLYIVFATAGAIVAAMLLISIVTCILRTKLRQQPHKQSKYMASSTYSTEAAASHKPLHTDASGFVESEATAYDYEPLPVSHVAYSSAAFGLGAPLTISPARQPIEIEPARSGSTTVSHQSQADDGAQLLSFNTSNLTSTTTCDNTSRSSTNADSTVRVDMSRFKQRTHALALADGVTPLPGAIPVSVPVVHKFGTLPLKSARSARTNVANADGKVATTPTGNNALSTFGLPPFVPPSTTDLGCLATPSNAPPDPWQRLADPHSQSLVRLHDDATATLEPEYAQPCFVAPQKTHTRRRHSPHSKSRSASSHSRSGGSPCNCPQCCDCADCRQPRTFDNEQPLVAVLTHGNTVSAAVPMPLTFALPPPPPLPAAEDDAAATRRNKKTLKKKSDCGVAQDDNANPTDRQNVRRTRTLRDDESRRGRSRSRDARTDRSRSRQRPRAAVAPNTSDSSSTGRSRNAADPTLVVMLNRKDAPVSSLALADNARQTVI